MLGLDAVEARYLVLECLSTAGTIMNLKLSRSSWGRRRGVWYGRTSGMFGQWSTKLKVLPIQGTDPLTYCTRVDRCFAQVSCFLVESNPEGRLMATLDGAGGGTGSARLGDDSVHGGDMNGCWSQRSWLPRTTTLSTRWGARSQPPGLMESRQVQYLTRKNILSTRKKPSVYDTQKTLLRPLEKNLPCTTLKNPLSWFVGWLVGSLVGGTILMSSTPLPWTPLPRAPLLRTIQNFAFFFFPPGFHKTS